MAVCEEDELKPVIGLLNGEDRYLLGIDNPAGYLWTLSSISIVLSLEYA